MGGSEGKIGGSSLVHDTFGVVAPTSSQIAPGKQTLSEQLPQIPPPQNAAVAGDIPASSHGAPVQRAASRDGASGGDAPRGEAVQRAAAEGVAGAGEPLPHRALIQMLFGRHDVGGVHAHVGDAAATASRAIGAEAYATGNQVAFAAAPNLHTAAHEAAHVVQQRGGVQLKGGAGEVGDAYERHADAVADHVVQGKNAERLLDEMAPSSPSTTGASGQAVQRKADAGSGGGPELERPSPPSAELLDTAEDPAPQLPVVSHGGTRPGHAAVRAEPAAGPGAPGGSSGSHDHARAPGPGAMETAVPDAAGDREPPAPASQRAESGSAADHARPARHDGDPARGPTAGHDATERAGAAVEGRSDAGTGARPGAEAGSEPRRRDAASRGPSGHEPTAQPPSEAAPADGHADPDGSATVVSVGVRPAAVPQPSSPIPALIPGSIAAHVKLQAEAHAGLAPPAAAAMAPPAAAMAPPAVGAEAHDVADPAGPVPSIATRAPAAVQPVRFAAPSDAEREPDGTAPAAHADAFATAAQQRVAALRSYVDESARALEPRLATADKAIDAAKGRSQAAIRAAMAHLRTGAAASVAGASAEITQQHERTVAIVRGAGLAAKARLDALAQTAAEAIGRGEAQSVPQLDAAYAAGDQQFRQSGELVGREAIAIGRGHRAAWMAQLDGESTIMSGPVHDNKLKARAKAADQVSEAYRDQLVGAANQQADGAQGGKARDREVLAAATAAHRNAILATIRDAHASIAHAEASAIEAADHQRDQDLKLLTAQHASTLKTIARKESALLGEVGKHAAGHKRALRSFVQAAVASCAGATDELVGSFDASMAGFRAQAAGTAAPSAAELEPALRQQHGQVQQAAEASEAKFREVFAGADQQIAATAGDSGRGFAAFDANTHAAAAQINASIAHTVKALTQHSHKAFTAIEQQHAGSVQATTDAADQASQRSVAAAATAYSGMTASLATSFGSSAKGLETNLRAALKDIHPQIQTSADQAASEVQPRWKKVLKVFVMIAVVVVVAVVAGPAVIGAIGAIAGGLGAGAAAGAIGVVVGGAAVGAVSGAAIQISNNVIDGNKWHEGVGSAAAVGAISGVFGGVGGLAAKGIGSLAIRTLVNLGFDGAGSVVGNLATGQPLTFEGIAMGLAIGLGMSIGMGGFAKFGGRSTKLAAAGQKLGVIQDRAEKAGEALGQRAVNAVKRGGAGVEPTPVVKPTAEPVAAVKTAEVEPVAPVKTGEVEPTAAVKTGEVEPKPAATAEHATASPRVAKAADELTDLLARDPDGFITQYRKVAAELPPEELAALRDSIRTRGRATPATTAGMKQEQLIEFHQKRLVALREIGDLDQNIYHGSGSSMLDGLAKTDGQILPAAELERRDLMPKTGEGSKFTGKGGPKEFVSVGEGESGFGTAMAYADANKSLAHYNPRLLSDVELQTNIKRLEYIEANYDSVKNEVQGPLAGLGVREKDHFTDELRKLRQEATRRVELPPDSPVRQGGHMTAENHPILFEFDMSNVNVKREARAGVRQGGALGGEASVYGAIDLKKTVRRVYAPAEYVHDVEQKLAQVLGHHDFEVIAMEAVDRLPKPGVLGSSRAATYKNMADMEKQAAAVDRAYEVAVREGRPVDVMLLIQEMTR